MNTVAIVRIVLLISIFASMITTCFFMLPGLYMWLPLMLSMLHIVVSIVGLVGVLSALSVETGERTDKGWYCSMVHCVAVLVEAVILLIAVIYWGAATAKVVKRWYTNGSIVIGVFMLIIDVITFIASAVFIGFVSRAKALPSVVNSSHDGTIVL